MWTRLLLGLLLVLTALGHANQSALPDTVEVPCGVLRLHAYLWKPKGPGPFPAVLFNHGSGDIDANHTAGMTISEAAAELAPYFIRHGYAFLYLSRRGQGLSAEQAPFLQDRLRREEATHGSEARDALQIKLLTTEQLEDVMAGLAFLQRAHEIDPRRIAMIGHSFGGQLTLLALQRDNTIRAGVTFGAAAASWDHALATRELLRNAAAEADMPIMLIHASNDYSTAAGRSLAEERERLHKPVVLKIYQPVGHTADDGHNMVYGAVSLWEDDVFKFLDDNVKH
jgi:dienelactone hydrolase